MGAHVAGGPLRVGLTGGIGSGKTTVADQFAALGVPVFDADRFARDLVQPGEPALDEIVAAFGGQVLDPHGHLDRSALRQRVFADPEARRRLEAILHPRIRTAFNAALEGLEAPYAILVIPLLLETAQQDLVDRVLVVEAPEALRIQRVMARDGVDADQVRAILAAQAGPERRREAADELIENRGSLEQLRHAVECLHEGYLRLAGN